MIPDGHDFLIDCLLSNNDYKVLIYDAIFNYISLGSCPFFL